LTLGKCLHGYLEETLPLRQERNQDVFVSYLVLVVSPKYRLLNLRSSDCGGY